MTDKLKRYAKELPLDERRDRTWFDELKQELEEHADRIEVRIERFFRRALIALSILGVSSTIGLIGFGIVLKKQSNTSKQIQKQRFEVQVENCLDQNSRHDKVITKIDDAIAALPEKRKARAEKNSQPFKLILEAAVPFTEDCIGVAQSRVKETK